MLPDVDVDDGHKVGAHISDEVLVSRCTEGKRTLALVVHEPAPAGALDSSGALVEDFDELVEATPAIHDLVVKGTAVGQGAVRLRAERVPEELVVKVTAAVEADGL